MMGTVNGNGKERTADEVAVLAVRSGLRVEKVWVCRGLVWITELRVGEDLDEEDEDEADLEEAREDLESGTEVEEGLEG